MLSGTSRRTFLQISASLLSLSWARLKGWAGLGGSSGPPASSELRSSQRLFPSGLADAEWSAFEAAGNLKPVTGIYRTHGVSYFSSYVARPRPASGMPLGGIDTGALYLEPSGVVGYFAHFAGVPTVMLDGPSWPLPADDEVSPTMTPFSASSDQAVIQLQGRQEGSVHNSPVTSA